MNRGANQRIQVPDDLREVLLEFTISYLLEQPAEVINYAADYFTRLRDARTIIENAPVQRAGSDADAAPTSPDESVISNEEEHVERGENDCPETNVSENTGLNLQEDLPNATDGIEVQ